MGCNILETEFFLRLLIVGTKNANIQHKLVMSPGLYFLFTWAYKKKNLTYSPAVLTVYKFNELCRQSFHKLTILTSPLLADELLFTDDVLCPMLGVLSGDSVVPFTAVLDVPFTFTPVVDEEDVPLPVLPAVRVVPLASLKLSANWRQQDSESEIYISHWEKLS